MRGWAQCCPCHFPHFSFLLQKSRLFSSLEGGDSCVGDRSPKSWVLALGSWFLYGVEPWVLLSRSAIRAEWGVLCDSAVMGGTGPPCGVENRPAPNTLPCLLLKEDQTPESNLRPTEVGQMWNMGPDDSWALFPWMSLSCCLTFWLNLVLAAHVETKTAQGWPIQFCQEQVQQALELHHKRNFGCMSRNLTCHLSISQAWSCCTTYGRKQHSYFYHELRKFIRQL